MDDPLQFGRAEWMGQTVLHPLGLLVMLVLGTALLVLPRRYAVLPMFLAACFVAPAQRVVVLSLNFTLLRLLLLFGTARILLRGEARGVIWKPIDTVFVIFVLVATILYIVQVGSAEAVKWRLGWAFDAIGIYFVCRALVHDWHDFDTLAKAATLLAIPIALAFVVEHVTGRNPFAFFGGVPEVTVIRDERMRCQGPFAHPIIAGSFWTILLPLMAAQWWNGARRVLVGGGVAAAGLIIVTCASSTPLTGVLCGLVGAAFFVLRNRMRQVYWAGLATLIGLHLMMKAPVWHLLARIDLVGGSTGWDRYNLVEQAVRHFGEWWLLGTQNTGTWDARGFLDVINQYVYEGLNGGLLTLALFVALIVMAFQSVGRLWRAHAAQRPRMIAAWALGTALFVHVMTFFSLSYFGQMTLLWYLTLAVIASLSPAASAGAPVTRGYPAAVTEFRAGLAGVQR